MFEEVPRERRGLARLVPVRRVVLGPFVLGGGMLLAALGGSVAVAAAAATMITASAIGSDEAPARPGHQVSSSASSTQQSLSAKRSPARHRAAPLLPGGQHPVAHRTGAPAVPTPAGVPGIAGSTTAPQAAPPTQARTLTAAAPTRTAGPTATPSSAAGTTSPAPSASAPLGNAVIHVSGYDPASQRLAYQFASVQPGADGDVYQISGPETFTAALAPSITITSGGSLCPPAGSACTVDQLIQAADSGFFAVAAIDVRGEIRSVIEVGDPPASPKLTPAPSTEASATPTS